MVLGLRAQSCLLVLCAAVLLRADNPLNIDILTVLGSADGVSTFASYLQNQTELVDLLNGGNFTVIAPNDHAFTQLGSSTIDHTTLGALLNYLVVRGIVASGEFSTTPRFLPTLLNDTTFTNVTGGQRVELVESNGVATVITGLKSPSKVVQADLFYAGGLIHIVDAVLTIPKSLSDTITQAGLDDLTALLNDGGWLAPSPRFEAPIALPDLTVFGPNDPRFGASFTGFEGLSDDERLAIFAYHCVEGQVLYSTELTNDTHFNTLDNVTVTSYVIDNQTYVNNAQIITKDYLVANGVLQIIDYLLDPSNTTATPNVTESSTRHKSAGSGLSSGAKAGIAVGVILLVLFLAASSFFFIRRHKRQGRSSRQDGSKKQEESVNHGPLDHERKAPAELGGQAVICPRDPAEADSSPIFESGGHRKEFLDKKNGYGPPPVEIDGGEVHHPTKSGASEPVTENWSNLSSAGERGSKD